MLHIAGRDLVFAFHESFSSYRKPGDVLEFVESLQNVGGMWKGVAKVECERVWPMGFPYDGTILFVFFLQACQSQVDELDDMAEMTK